MLCLTSKYNTTYFKHLIKLITRVQAFIFKTSHGLYQYKKIQPLTMLLILIGCGW